MLLPADSFWPKSWVLCIFIAFLFLVFIVFVSF